MSQHQCCVILCSLCYIHCAIAKYNLIQVNSIWSQTQSPTVGTVSKLIHSVQIHSSSNYALFSLSHGEKSITRLISNRRDAKENQEEADINEDGIDLLTFKFQFKVAVCTHYTLRW